MKPLFFDSKRPGFRNYVTCEMCVFTRDATPITAEGWQLCVMVLTTVVLIKNRCFAFVYSTLEFSIFFLSFCFLMLSVNDKTEHLKGNVMCINKMVHKNKIFLRENYYNRLVHWKNPTYYYYNFDNFDYVIGGVVGKTLVYYSMGSEFKTWKRHFFFFFYLLFHLFSR